MTKLFDFEEKSDIQIFDEKCTRLKVMAKDESLKDMAFRKIFDKNPFLEFFDKETYTFQPPRSEESMWSLRRWYPTAAQRNIDPKNRDESKIMQEASWV